MIRMLYLLNVAKKVNNFSYSSMVAAKRNGFEFHIAGNWSYKDEKERIKDEKKYGIKIHQIDFIRNIYHPGNIKAYRQLVNLVKKYRYDVIHCNTPIAGVIGRIVGVKYNVLHIIYQVHGFHFYKGAPIINWMVFYPIERLLSRFTDVLITINNEDYLLACSKFHLRGSGRIYYIPGVGIDETIYKPQNMIKERVRKTLNITDNQIMIISVGDLIKRKNYKTSINAIKNTDNPKLQYFICGEGPMKEELEKYTKKIDIEKQVHFLGFRDDVKELLQAADVFLISSLQEGLPRVVMEAMASGVVCVASNIRGNKDLINSECGYLVNTCDSKQYARVINELAEEPELRELMGELSIRRIKGFNIDTVVSEIRDVYNDILREELSIPNINM